MNATRARGLALLLLAASWSARAQGVPPVAPPGDSSAPIEAPPPAPGPDAAGPPIEAVPPPDPSELDRAPVRDAPLLDPEEAYEQQFIGFDDFGAVVTHHGEVTGTVQWSVPYEGKYKRPLTGEAFYRKLGRADLVKEYEDRDALRTGLMVGGTIVLIGGLITAAILQSNLQNSQAPQDCGTVPGSAFAACVDRAVYGPHPTPSVDPFAASAALIGVVGGGAMVWAGAATDPNPIGTVEARQLADAYNRDLRQRLGATSQAEGVDFRVVPHLEKDGGAGLTLAIRF